MIVVGIDTSFAHAGYDIYIFDRVHNQRFPYRISIERLEPIPCGVKMEPSMHLDEPMGREIINAFIAALRDEDLLPKSTAAETELVATKYHLEDMRCFVFNNRPEIKETTR